VKEAYITLKDLLTSELLLQYTDFTKPYVLTTDASNEALGQFSAKVQLDEISQLCMPVEHS